MSSPTEKSIWFLSHKQLFVSEVYETLRVPLRMYGRRTGRHIVCLELGVTRTYCILKRVPIIKRVPPSLYYTKVFSMVSVPCVKLKMSSEFPREEKRPPVFNQVHVSSFHSVFLPDLLTELCHQAALACYFCLF